MKNQRMLPALLGVLLAVLLVIPAAQAADYSIGGGLGVAPDYEGSSDYELVPVPTGSAQFSNGMYVELLGLNLRANLLWKSCRTKLCCCILLRNLQKMVVF